MFIKVLEGKNLKYSFLEGEGGGGYFWGNLRQKLAFRGKKDKYQVWKCQRVTWLSRLGMSKLKIFQVSLLWDNLHFSGVLSWQAEIGHIAVSCASRARKVSGFGVHDVWSSRTDAQILPCVGTRYTSVFLPNIMTWENHILTFCPFYRRDDSWKTFIKKRKRNHRTVKVLNRVHFKPTQPLLVLICICPAFGPV